MNPLESRYRRILTLLPRAYRERRGEEMLTSLLDGASEGQRWPRWGEATSVVGLAVRLRAGAPGGSSRAVFGGDVLRRVALAGLLMQALLFVRSPISAIAMGLHFGFLDPVGAEGIGWRLVSWAFSLGLTLVPLAAFVALLFGLRRTGRVLSVMPAALMTVLFIEVRPFEVTSDYIAVTALAYLVCASVFLGFHRDAQRIVGRGRWLGVMLGSMGVTAAVIGTAVALSYVPANGYWGAATLLGRISTFVYSPLGPALAIGVGLVRARESALWPATLFLLGLPMLVIVPRNVILLGQGKEGHTFPSDLFAGNSWPDLGLECLATEVVLAATLYWALRRSGVGRRATGRPTVS